MEEAVEVEIPEGDIRVDVFRSSGPGGQCVNTTDSAVRLTHLPTGIVVSMQNEKSQIQNRAAAMRVLQTRLLILQKEQEAANKKELAGVITASWGDQMRSYFLYGQQLVKDLRTGHEVGNPAAVFDGDLDGFIAAGIRWRKQRQGLAQRDRRRSEQRRTRAVDEDAAPVSGPRRVVADRHRVARPTSRRRCGRRAGSARRPADR